MRGELYEWPAAPREHPGDRVLRLVVTWALMWLGGAAVLLVAGVIGWELFRLAIALLLRLSA